MSDFDSFIVFDKKSLSDLFKEVHTKSNKKDKEITDLITQLKDLITNIGDALQLVPLISSYLDISVKNNEHLIKMLAIVQKAMSRTQVEGEDKDYTKEERDQLYAEWGGLMKDAGKDKKIG